MLRGVVPANNQGAASQLGPLVFTLAASRRIAKKDLFIFISPIIDPESNPKTKEKYEKENNCNRSKYRI